jgi:hypothetical protein
VGAVFVGGLEAGGAGGTGFAGGVECVAAGVVVAVFVVAGATYGDDGVYV